MTPAISMAVATKADRYLVSGRLSVERVDDEKVIASCWNDTGQVYRLEVDRGTGRGTCTCPARRLCAHRVALQRVVR